MTYAHIFRPCRAVITSPDLARETTADMHSLFNRADVEYGSTAAVLRPGSRAQKIGFEGRSRQWCAERAGINPPINRRGSICRRTVIILCVRLSICSVKIGVERGESITVWAGADAGSFIPDRRQVARPAPDGVGGGERWSAAGGQDTWGLCRPAPSAGGRDVRRHRGDGQSGSA